MIDSEAGCLTIALPHGACLAGTATAGRPLQSFRATTLSSKVLSTGRVAIRSSPCVVLWRMAFVIPMMLPRAANRKATAAWKRIVAFLFSAPDHRRYRLRVLPRLSGYQRSEKVVPCGTHANIPVWLPSEPTAVRKSTAATRETRRADPHIGISFFTSISAFTGMSSFSYCRTFATISFARRILSLRHCVFWFSQRLSKTVKRYDF